jgi:hypothetical protein
MFRAGLRFELGFDQAVCAAWGGRQTGAYCRTQMQAQTQFLSHSQRCQNQPKRAPTQAAPSAKSIRRAPCFPKLLNGKKIDGHPLAKVVASITGSVYRAPHGQIHHVAVNWTAGPRDKFDQAETMSLASRSNKGAQPSAPRSRSHLTNLRSGACQSNSRCLGPIEINVLAPGWREAVRRQSCFSKV